MPCIVEWEKQERERLRSLERGLSHRTQVSLQDVGQRKEVLGWPVGNESREQMVQIHVGGQRTSGGMLPRKKWTECGNV